MRWDSLPFDVVGIVDLGWQHVQRFRLLGPQQVNQQVEYVLVLLPGRTQYAGEDRLRPCPVFRAVATPVLADHHQDPHDPLGHIVGRLQTGTVQESKQVRTFVAQVLDETLIGPIALAAGQQAVQLRFQPARSRPHPMQRDLLLPIAVPQGQGLLQELFYGQGKAGGPGGGLRHLLATVNQVKQTALMRGLHEFVVQPQPVMNQPARVAGPQDLFRLGKSASRQNLTEGDLFGDHRPQPA